jgi:long-chain acyl-CoA synthetase
MYPPMGSRRAESIRLWPRRVGDVGTTGQAGRFPGLGYGDRAVNLASIIDAHPDGSVALISRGQPTTYGELRQQVAALRGGLAGLGLVPGDRLALLAGNNWYFVVAYLAALGAGLVVVPMNPQAPAPEQADELARTRAKAVVVTPAAASAFASIDRSGLPALEAVIESSGVDLPDAVLLDDLVAADPVDLVERAPEDLALLMFTSGTVGAPRAAMLSHGNLRANLDQILASGDDAQRADDVVFGLLPLFHIFGLNVVLNLSLRCGSRVLLIERFDPSSAIEAIERHEVTMIGGPPTMWSALVHQPGVLAASFATVRSAVSGAAPLSVELVDEVRDRLGLELGNGYGLTETSPVVTSAAGTGAPAGSIGAVVPGVEVRVVDADGDDVLVGDSGEILVRGPNVFGGYWEDTEATAAAIDADGWLHTGDLAVMDDEGYVFLVDRAKDLVIVSGFNVVPAEVEAVLMDHPAVQAAAVVGVPHPHTGEAVKAFVVVAPGQSLDEDGLIDFCSERLARYKCPSKVMFVEELPHNVSGKLLRRALR